MVWKIAPGSPHSLHKLSSKWGGGAIPSAKLLWAKEMLSLWNAVRLHDNALRKLAHWEWINSLAWIGCSTDVDTAKELTTPIVLVLVSDLSNQFRRVSMQLGAVVTWLETSPSPSDLTIGQVC